MLSVNIIGTQKIQNKLSSKISDTKLEQILDIAAMMVERDAKRLCPVDTGRLRASIDIQKPQSLVRSIGTSVEYAPYQEFGTSRIRPQPYLRPALEQNKYKIMELIKQE